MDSAAGNVQWSQGVFGNRGSKGEGTDAGGVAEL